MPLRSRGLEAGDDAVLFVLGRPGGLTEAELGEEVGQPAEALAARLDRLIERDLVVRKAIGPELVPGLQLTERGERIRVVLAGNWQELEAALFGELTHKRRSRVGKALRRFIDLLRL